MSKVLKKKSHWTSKVHETVICRDKDGELNVEIKGGAENGLFSYLGEMKHNKINYQDGKLHTDELLLEVNDTAVSGLTIRDVLAVIKHCKDPIRLKCVKQGVWKMHIIGRMKKILKGGMLANCTSICKDLGVSSSLEIK
ncbi:hypothetical protein chiPu_0011239 [Chiloscyllium punctatum]|uniref:PDZ domain-containing protein n=1 Tax=Chiloscyllium punctatum TaxID=137246 RepID=A0A401SQU8_CHIPU|nr:hypothetical protein [Chiloscyllium punctatum]